jgi:hypothetical protein
MLDTSGATRAVRLALRSLDAAAAVEVPWLRGSGEALATVRSHLDTASTHLEQAAGFVRNDASDAAELLDQAATLTRETSAAAQSRFGVRNLGERVTEAKELVKQHTPKVQAVQHRQAAEELVATLGRSYDEMTPASWTRLAELAELPAHARPEGLAFASGTSMPEHLRQVAGLIEGGKPIKADWNGWSILNKLRAEAQFADRPAAVKRLREIAYKPRAELTRQDLHDLDGLLQLPENVRPAAIRHASSISTAVAAELRGARLKINPEWDGWAIHEAATLDVRLPTDPAERAEWVRAQLLQRVAGKPADSMLGTLLRLRPELVPEEHLETARLAIANELLRDIAEVGATSPTSSRPALEAAKRALAGWTPKNPEHQPIAKQTIKLIDDNLKRMDFKHGWRDEGYLNYPDYAEVGRVRSNIDLLEKLTTLESAPVPGATPVSTAAEAVSPTGEATSGTVEEVLSW